MNTTHPKKRRGRALATIITATLVAAAIGTGWLARGTSTTQPAFRYAEASRGEIVQIVSASGTLNPVNTVEVGSQVSGNVSKILVDYNDPVSEGQLIAEIDPRTYEAHVLQSTAQLESAQAALDLSELEATRAAQLLEKKLISQSDYDTAVVQHKQQKATVAIRQAELENARTNLARTRIYAPIHGTILSRSVSEGQTVQASFSAPTLFEIAQDLKQMEISADVSEADIGNVSAGQQATFTVDAFPGRTFRGTVRQVRNKPTESQSVVTYSTIITVQNDDLKLRPGMTANVTITTASRPAVLRVPNSALRFKPASTVAVQDVSPDTPAAPTIEGPPPAAGNTPGGMRPARRAANNQTESATETVYVLQAPGESSTDASSPIVVLRKVMTGISDGAMTEIISGLNKGDIVITGNALPAASGTVASTETVNPFAPKPPGRR